MSKSREQMVIEIEMMADTMRPEFDDLKIKDNHLSLPDEAVFFPKDLITEGHKWLDNVYKTEFAPVRTVRNLLSTDQWQRYKLWGSFGETQEMILLKEKQVPLRKVLVARDRPNLFKKGKQNEQLKKLHSEKGKESSGS